MEKTSAPADLRAIIVSIDLLRTNQDNLEQFNSIEFIELARSSGLKVEHHIFSKQNFVSASHFLTKGKAEMNINSKTFKEYFPTAVSQFKILQPLTLTNNLDQFNININVVGGGVSGQVEAIRLALSRALCLINEENRKILKPEGLLTRDSRNVERKKYGRKKARKKFQFSKR